MSIATELPEFKTLLGSILLYFQAIEHDLKLIYNRLHPNAPIEKEYKSSGEIIDYLRPSFTPSAIAILSTTTSKRNYWCHQCYIDFIYQQDEKSFKQVYNQLKVDYDNFRKVQQKLQEFRINLYSTKEA